MQTKRLLSVFLAVAMLVTLTAVPVYAEEPDTACGNTPACILPEGHEGPCDVSQQAPVCVCTDKCTTEAINADCPVCTQIDADAMQLGCAGQEAVFIPCDVEGCELAKDHPGEHTAAGNYVACDGDVTPEQCEATEHIPGCSAFAVRDTESFKAALNAGMTEIKLAEDFTITETILIPSGKEIFLDMNGKNITTAAGVNPAIRVLGKLAVSNGKMDTAQGEADGYCFIVGGSADAEQIPGELIIESGVYHGAASAVSVTLGTAIIRGGTFSAEPADGMEESLYVLNCIDANYQAGTAGVSVTGGSFVGFDPADNRAEGENTDFLANGKCVAREDNVYTVGQHAVIHVSAQDANCQSDGNIAHWRCNHCGKLYDAVVNGNALTADAVITTNGTHDLKKQEAVAPTCQADGTIEHWKCTVCEKLFDKKTEGRELTESEIKDTNRAHDLKKQEALAATCQKDGHIEHYRCETCEGLFEDAAATQVLTQEDVKTTGTHDLKYEGGQKAAYDAEGIRAHYYCEVEGCGKAFSDAMGNMEMEDSVVIPMLSHVENGIVFIDEDAIANEGKKNVVLDLLQEQVMGSLQEVTQVLFQLTCLEDHVNQGGTLRVCLSDGEVYFDNDALKTIVTKARGSTVTLLMDEISKTDAALTAKQKTTLNEKKDPYLVRLKLTSGGKDIEDKFGGKVYVYLTKFVPKSGYSNSNYSAYFLDDNGQTDAVSYYSRDARITVEHFSEYFLSRNVKAASNPSTGDTSNVMVWAGVGLTAVVALAVLLVLNRKKQH